MIRLLGPLIVLLPFIEIAGFVVIGGWIGLGLTLLWVLVAAIAGLGLIRQGGLNALVRLRAALAEGREPGHSLIDGAALVVAGFLLVLPGFFSDILALILILPVTRDFLLRRAARHFETRVHHGVALHTRPGRPGGTGPTTVIEGEFEIVGQDGDGDAQRVPPPPASRKDP